MKSNRCITNPLVRGVNKSNSTSSSSSFQTLVAGWENNCIIGKGIKASTVVSYPGRNVIEKNITDTATNTVITITTSQTSVPSSPVVPSRPTSIFSTSHYRSSSNLYSPNSSFNSHSPTNISISSRNAELKEKFMTNGDVTHSQSFTPVTTYLTVPGGGTQQHAQHETLTPTYGGFGYRFAGVERLAQRGKIYNLPSPDAQKGFDHTTNESDKDYVSSNTGVDTFFYSIRSNPTGSIQLLFFNCKILIVQKIFNHYLQLNLIHNNNNFSSTLNVTIISGIHPRQPLH